MRNNYKSLYIRLLSNAKKKKLINKNFSIISNDCIGGFLYNQYGLRFLSPTINLYFEKGKFLYFCKYLDHYLNGYFIEKKDVNKYYPVGELIPDGDDLPPITIFFKHCKSFGEAINDWERRKTRIQLDNIFIIFNGTASLGIGSSEEATIFNNLPYPKIYLYSKDNNDIISQVMDKYDLELDNGTVYFDFYKNRFLSKLLNKRYFNKYNFTRFFNKK